MGEIIRFTVAGSPQAVSRAIEEYAHGEGRVSAIVVPWESDAATLSMAVTAVKSDGWAIEHTNLGTKESHHGGRHPAGEKENEPFQFTFNGFLKVEFQGSRVTSDAGLILVRELDERLGLETFIAEHLSDSRQGLNTQFRLADLLQQSVYSRLAGYEDLNDAERLATDPTFRMIGIESHDIRRGRGRRCCSTSSRSSATSP